MSPTSRQGAQCLLLPHPLEAAELTWILGLSPGSASGPEVSLGVFVCVCVYVCIYEHGCALGVSGSLGLSSLGLDSLRGLRVAMGSPGVFPH